ncbi:VWA-like domain-containing protein [Ammoniphilus sp. YIM 78166]|uniref:vWA domain-containing protein n=1 Tax=Ammoniphilus sp. YIM 78166 TaxID=1644106 RepID=UPI00106F202D|nr:VWA-like domain-containing protein [Ammoniphilus sp. YIM 78166]
MSKRKKPELDIALKNYSEALQMLHQHPMFAPLALHARFYRQDSQICPDDGWAVVTRQGAIHVHPTRRGEVSEWMYVLAHCLLHLGFGHFQAKENKVAWNTACDCFIAKFLSDMKWGTPPKELSGMLDFRSKSEEDLYLQFSERGIPEPLRHWGVGGSQGDLVFSDKYHYWNRDVDWEACLGKGLSMAVTSAVKVAAGYTAFLGEETHELTPAAKARNWFIDHYPLLGSLAASFKLIEDPAICARLDISVAAIDIEDREIYMNPASGLDEHECKFVIAHELLHAGLRHHERCQGRDPYLWNVACDYVINGWLVEIGIGEFPKVGGLMDPELKGLSTEAIYDRIVTDIRTYRKLYTLRGIGLGDMLDKGNPGFWEVGEGTTLDDFFRNCLTQGLIYHQEQNRGFIPAGLIEEIRALGQPPIKWDVELARWFDHYFAPLEQNRTYARASRRQSSTPDIPRPRWVPSGASDDGRTFGVVLDTSGSMDKKILAKALGAISSYSLSRDVPAVRVVFCDAAAYDEGYLAPEVIADKVRIKGRGGTILQPGIDLLENAEDFPKKGPLLIITDGYCERLRLKRDHAFLLPKGRHLPFIPKGPVFYLD